MKTPQVTIERMDVMQFDFNIVKRQIITEYLRQYGNDCPNDEWSLGNVIDVFRKFYRKYQMRFSKAHPKLSSKTVREIIVKLPHLYEDVAYGALGDCIELTPEHYDTLIDAYFDQAFEDCNYSMAHFMSGKIRELRVYERIYYGD